MSRTNRRDAFEVLRDANPAPAEPTGGDDRDAALARAIALGESGRELLADGEEAPRGASGWSIRRPAALGVGAAGAAAAAVVAIVVFGGGSVGPGKERAYAAEAVEIAEANPRLLIGAPGWSVTQADELDPDRGSMTFGNGEDELLLNWFRLSADYPEFELTGPNASLPRPDQWYEIPIGDCASPNGPVDCRIFQRRTEIELINRPAVIEETRMVDPRHPPRSTFTAYLPMEEGTIVQIAAGHMSAQEFRYLLLQLYPAGVDAWLASLPPRVVQPLERPEIVDEMLADVPIHPSVDVESLKGRPAAASRYQLGAGVTSAVACAWLDQWAAAVDTGDTAAAREAIEAMSTSRDWDILREMEDQGGWAQVIWEYAEEMRRDDRHALLGAAGTETLPDGRVYELRPSYATGLGCDSERRVLRDEPADPPDFPDPIPVDAPTARGAQP